MKKYLMLTASSLALAACDPSTYLSSVPIAEARGNAAPAAIYTYPVPLCLFICTSHISAIREDALATGGGSLTTGAKSSTSSSSGTNSNSN